VANPDQADTDGDGRGDLCEARHLRSISLSLRHVSIDGTTELDMAGTVSVADTATKCVSGRQVYLARYDATTGTWERLGIARTSADGDFLMAVPDVPDRYQARVPRQYATYDGFTSTCSAAGIRKTHTH
jgi:hypothetical protein